MKKNIIKKLVSGIACLTLAFTFTPLTAYAGLTDAISGIKDIADDVSGLADKVIKIGQVTGLTEDDIESNEIELEWDNVTLAKTYNIYKYNSSAEKYEKIGESTTNEYTVTSLNPATVYKFKVSAVNSSGEEGDKSEVYTTCTEPEKVGNLAAKKTKNTVTLSWSKVARATKYQIYKYNAKDGTWKRVANTEKLSYKVSDLKAATSYKFKVRAYRKVNGDIYYGDFKSITVKTTGSSTSSSGFIGEEKAKSIALEKAKIKEANAEYLMINMDTEDGVKIYEVEFESGNLEYNFEINAKTGRIIEFEKENVWD